MIATGRKRGRKKVYDAERTRVVILNAAEAGFAEHGFDGVSVDAIATAAGYNKSLIFQYYGDKLSLYAAVLKRADQEMSELLARVFAPLLEDEAIVTDARRFREFLKTTLETFFDYMVDHPQFTRILNWEQAAGWQSFARISSQFAPDDLAKLEAIFSKAQGAGLVRGDLNIIVMILLVQQVCWSSLNALPMYQMLLAGKDFSPDTTFGYVRKQIIEFLIAGIIYSPQDHV